VAWIWLDYHRKGSVVRSMKDTDPIDPIDASWKAEAIDGLLAALGTELEAAMEAVIDAKAEQRMPEIVTHCVKASALAIASQTILDHKAAKI